MTSPVPDLDATPAERAQRSAASYVVGYYDAPFFPGMVTPPVPDPHIDALVPTTAVAGSGALDVQVNGLGFEATSVVEVDGAAQATTFVSATRLTARYTPPAGAGVHQFSVRNVNGFESNDVPFVVTAPPAIPRIDTLDPASVVAGSGEITVDVWGANYLPSSVVVADGVDLPTTLESTVHLAATWTTPDVAGDVQFSVRNGATGTASGNRPLTVTDTTTTRGRRRLASGAAADTMPAADGGATKKPKTT